MEAVVKGYIVPPNDDWRYMGCQALLQFWRFWRNSELPVPATSLLSTWLGTCWRWWSSFASIREREALRRNATLVNCGRLWFMISMTMCCIKIGYHWLMPLPKLVGNQGKCLVPFSNCFLRRGTAAQQNSKKYNELFHFRLFPMDKRKFDRLSKCLANTMASVGPTPVKCHEPTAMAYGGQRGTLFRGVKYLDFGYNVPVLEGYNCESEVHLVDALRQPAHIGPRTRRGQMMVGGGRESQARNSRSGMSKKGDKIHKSTFRHLEVAVLKVHG
ncbi:hypothetical protein K438DRAFT_1752603 [Mycena galopus ATCC 62051]|nr:hypothetical protein K438DRAFT_1752603 [Mycena galopus ATCC 62051]